MLYKEQSSFAHVVATNFGKLAKLTSRQAENRMEIA